MASRVLTVFLVLQIVQLSIEQSITQNREQIKDVKRILFDGFLLGGKDQCKKCYDCWCKHDCDWSALSCPSIIKDADCHARYHQDGGWTHWANWSPCVGACGFHGYRTRSRSCTNPVKHNCGSDCQGQASQTDNSCWTYACPLVLSSFPTQPPTTPTVKPTTTTTTTTTTTPSTTVRTTVPTTTPESATLTSCDKLCSVSAVANNRSYVNSEADRCADGSYTGSEALVLDCCSLHTTDQWRRGPNVLQACTTSSIADYTPVAIFSGDRYVTDTSGIFAGCLSVNETGFKFIQQTCDTKPYIYHVTTTQPEHQAPSSYYVINHVS